MGSDFTYSDMASTTFDTNEADHTLLGEETLKQGNVCRGIGSPYHRRLWEDEVVGGQGNLLATQGGILRHGQGHGDQGPLHRRYRLYEGRWITRSITMTTLATQTKTRIEILQAKYDIPMNSGYFTTTFLETGRIL